MAFPCRHLYFLQECRIILSTRLIRHIKRLCWKSEDVSSSIKTMYFLQHLKKKQFNFSNPFYYNLTEQDDSNSNTADSYLGEVHFRHQLRHQLS
jgi:hypothetical protein